MSSNVNIRVATRNDFEGILELSQKLFEYERVYGKTYNMGWTQSPTGRGFFADRLERGVVIVAESGKNIIGYICGYIDTYAYRSVNPIAELENMFVKEKFRGTGVGTSMVKMFLKILKTKKVSRVKVGALAKNELAVSFYKKMGFDIHEVILERNVNGK